MPDISTPVSFSVDMEKTISSKTATATFTYHEWGTDDLLALRCHVRNHYRTIQRGSCAYCKRDVSLQAAENCHVEHIAPKSKYLCFIFEPKNLCVICADCNVIKREQEVLQNEPDPVVKGGSRKQYPRSSSAFKIVHPHFDVYEDHIEVFDTFYVDKSDKGHFTIGSCNLNRKLRKFGWVAEYDDAVVAAAAEAYLTSKTPVARHKALQELRRRLIQI